MFVHKVILIKNLKRGHPRNKKKKKRKRFFHARCKYLKDNKHNRHNLSRKSASIFVLGHYLFLKSHSFPRASLSENCSRQSNAFFVYVLFLSLVKSQHVSTEFIHVVAKKKIELNSISLFIDDLNYLLSFSVVCMISLIWSTN